MAPLRNFGVPAKVEPVAVILSTSKEAHKDATSISPTKPSGEGTPIVRRKYEMCKNWKEKGSCRYGDKCLFAHGEHELTRKKSSDTSSDTKEGSKISEVSKGKDGQDEKVTEFGAGETLQAQRSSETSDSSVGEKIKASLANIQITLDADKEN